MISWAVYTSINGHFETSFATWFLKTVVIITLQYLSRRYGGTKADPSFGDATIAASSALVAPVEAYKCESTALESTSTFGRYTRTLEFNDIQMEEVYSELRSLAPKLLDLMENLFE